MTAIDPNFDPDAEARKERLFTRINKADAWLNVIGLGFITPLLRIAAGDNPKAQGKELWRLAGVPLLAIAAFLVMWGTLAPRVQTSLGAIPGPAQVWEQVINLNEDAARTRERAADFYARQDERNAERIANGDEPRFREFTGAPTYYQQIWTSIKTVFFGFLLATVVAVPLGIAAGLSATANAALNPLIQVFKPVSPLAWLPIVSIVVSAVYVTDDGWFESPLKCWRRTLVWASLSGMSSRTDRPSRSPRSWWLSLPSASSAFCWTV